MRCAFIPRTGGLTPPRSEEMVGLTPDITDNRGTGLRQSCVQDTMIDLFKRPDPEAACVIPK